MPRIVRLHETGGPAVLRLEDLPSQEPGPDEVRIRVEAIGLNRAEILYRTGQYLEAPQFPARIGYEAAGTIDAVGSAVEGFQPGDRVSCIPAFSMNSHGVYGEEAVVPARAVAHIPPGLSSIEAAALWMPYLTAYGALVELADIGPADCVLIPAASSSVGIAAIQICNRVRAFSIATTRTSAKRAALQALGASCVIATEEEAMLPEVMQFTQGRGVRVVFDPVAGPGVETLAQVTGPGGVIFLYGILSMQPTPFPLFPALQKGLSLRGYIVFEITSIPERLAHARAWVTEGLAEGTLKPVIARTFPLDRIAEAHHFMEANTHIGKIVVTV